MTKELKNKILENKVLTHDERMEIIKALEQQENRRTVALIKPSQNTTTLRQLMQQPVVICTANTEVIAQSFISDVESVKDYLPKCNSMEFPKTFDEFANDYGFTDDKEIYTNGSHLIPVFRVKQWLDHIEQQPSEDCVSRQSMLDAITEIDENINMDIYTNEVREIIEALPPVTPIHKVGKWVRKPIRNDKGGCIGAEMICSCCNKDNRHDEYMDYCPNCGADMRGNEND